MSWTTEFQNQFEAFAKLGSKKSDGKEINLTQSDKWMKQAKVLDAGISTIDTAICFKKLRKSRLGLAEYILFLEDLTSKEDGQLNNFKNKMASCGPPAVRKMKKLGKAAASVKRLTDTSKYTGSHRQRFDRSGKGKGITGRKDVFQNDGYVLGYAEKDTYDEQHNEDEKHNLEEQFYF